MDTEMEQKSEEDDTPSAPNNLLQWSQWQLLDSLLPTGGFAHSYGLESAMQSRLVSNQDHLKSYVIQVLENTVFIQDPVSSGSLLLPFVYASAKSPNAETFLELDKRLEATLTNEISRKASTSQGRALVRVASSVFQELAILKRLRDDHLGSGLVYFHHAPVFGLICGLLGVDCDAAQRGYMFMTARDVLSAATRLNLIGPIGACVLQREVSIVGEGLVRKWMDRGVDDACQTAPLIDVVQGCHAYLFSRMFCS